MSGDGQPLLCAHGRPTRLDASPAVDESTLPALLAALTGAMAAMPAHSKVEVASYNGVPVRQTAAAAALAELGYVAGPLTMNYWAPTTAPVGPA